MDRPEGRLESNGARVLAHHNLRSPADARAPGQRVLLQRLALGGWRTLGRPAGATGVELRRSVPLPQERPAALRALLLADEHNLQSASAALAIRIASAIAIHNVRHVVIIAWSPPAAVTRGRGEP